jgi:hypothetical protein
MARGMPRALVYGARAAVAPKGALAASQATLRGWASRRAHGLRDETDGCYSSGRGSVDDAPREATKVHRAGVVHVTPFTTRSAHENGSGGSVGFTRNTLTQTHAKHACTRTCTRTQARARARTLGLRMPSRAPQIAQWAATRL